MLRLASCSNAAHRIVPRYAAIGHARLRSATLVATRRIAQQRFAAPFATRGHARRGYAPSVAEQRSVSLGPASHRTVRGKASLRIVWQRLAFHRTDHRYATHRRAQRGTAPMISRRNITRADLEQAEQAIRERQDSGYYVNRMPEMLRDAANLLRIRRSVERKSHVRYPESIAPTDASRGIVPRPRGLPAPGRAPHRILTCILCGRVAEYHDPGCIGLWMPTDEPPDLIREREDEEVRRELSAERRAIIRARVREYQKRPEVKAMRRERNRRYRQLDHVRAARAAYKRRPDQRERQQRYWQEYAQRPEVQEHRRAYEQRPEVREKRRVYDRFYRKRPKRERVEYRMTPELAALLNKPLEDAETVLARVRNSAETASS